MGNEVIYFFEAHFLRPETLACPTEGNGNRMTEPLTKTESEQPVLTFEAACAAYWRGEWRAMPLLMRICVVVGILVGVGLIVHGVYTGTHQISTASKSV